MLKVLFATSEVHPLIKTGGLGDVCGALPLALRDLNTDVRIALPGYRQVLHRCAHFRPVAMLAIAGSAEPVRILQGTLEGSDVPLYVVDAPDFFDRAGGPYATVEGSDWDDNAERFAVFCRAVVDLAMDRCALDWRPDVAHCHDWQTGLVPVLLARESDRPASVFTVHNLAYSGCFDRARFDALALPADLYTPQALEFYGRFCFIKGGLAYADVLTTVSPTYAQEIQTPEFGYGFDGLVRHRAADLVGILNGVDYAVWDPRRDPHIVEPYDAEALERKAASKRALQKQFGLAEDDRTMLLGTVTRLAPQKGMDLILEAMPDLWQEDVQLVILGTGDGELHHAINVMARAHPGRCGVYIGYDERIAHRIIAGADAFLMPSRYEPCGLAQMYSLRYGTLPIVRRTGGLADTIVAVSPESLRAATATGIVFSEASAAALAAAVRAALYLHRAPAQWRKLQRTGMAQDFGWKDSAHAYAQVYRRAGMRGRQ